MIMAYTNTCVYMRTCMYSLHVLVFGEHKQSEANLAFCDIHSSFFVATTDNRCRKKELFFFCVKKLRASQLVKEAFFCCCVVAKVLNHQR